MAHLGTSVLRKYCSKITFPHYDRLVKHLAGILMQLTLQYPRAVTHGKERRDPFLGNEGQTRNEMNNPRTRESRASRTRAPPRPRNREFYIVSVPKGHKSRDFSDPDLS